MRSFTPEPQRILPGPRRSMSRSPFTIPRPTSICAHVRPTWQTCATRVLQILRDGVTQVPKVPDGAIVCADDLPPSRFLEIDWSNGGGVALLRGSPTSRVALLARARGVPMVVQLGAVAETAQTALLDGERATLELDPGVDQVQSFARRQQARRKNRTAAHAILRRPAPFWEGEKIRLLINVQRVEDLEHDHAQYADGIGLMRTEFLPARTATCRTRESAVPRLRCRAALGRQSSGEFESEPSTPAVTSRCRGSPRRARLIRSSASRGLRLCLARADIFSVQLRALARAAMHRNLKVMFPMVTNPEELEAARNLFADKVARLQAEGIPAKLPELGIMVEVPAAALTIERFGASFFSVGSNDLVQYVTACDRTNGALAKLSDPLHPAVLELIRRVAGRGRRSGVGVSLAVKWRAIRAAFRRSCPAACVNFRSILRLWRRSSRRSRD